MANIVLPATSEKIRVVTRNTDERTQTLHAEGAPNINAGQVNISNSAATIVSLVATRTGVTICNRENRSVFIGEATVTTANGLELLPGACIYLPTTALVQGITASASVSTEMVHYIEFIE
jgi:hypothetical protein